MNISELLKTKRSKIFMGYIYSWGASIVLIGALFKLQHWPYSGFFLTVGLLTEAFIFFVSAFEPPLEIPEWSKVYPELKDDYEISEFDELERSGKNKFEELFGVSDITPDLLNKVSRGLNELSNTAKGISDISSATLATDLYVKNLNSASEAMTSFSEINSKANQSINHSLSQLVDTYQHTTQQLTVSGQAIIEKMNRTGEEFSSKVSESGNLLARSYHNASERMEQSLKNVGDSSRLYTENISKLSKNMEALNSTVESQLRGTELQFQASQKFNADLGRMNEILAASVDELKRYQENASKLNQHLEALNNIYGNMLGAMNYKK